MRLKSKDASCPVCGRKLVSNGRKSMRINHKVLSDRNMTVYLEIRRLKYRKCGHSEYEKNPLSYSGFNNSILTVNQIMRDLHDPRYNYTMIAQKNGVSIVS